MSRPWLSNTAFEGLPVIDLSGHMLGRVAAVDASREHFEVALSPRLRESKEHLDVAFSDIIDVDDHEVTLREEGEYLLHPERVPHDSVS